MTSLNLEGFTQRRAASAEGLPGLCRDGFQRGASVVSIELSADPGRMDAMSNEEKNIPESAEVEVTDAANGFRSDRALALLAPGIGRRAAKSFFHHGHITLNGRPAHGSERVHEGDRLAYPNPGHPKNRELFHHTTAPRLTTPHGRQIVRLYEDASLLVLAKPPEIPVHRGQGGFTRRDTLEDVLERAYPPTGPDGKPIKSALLKARGDARHEFEFSGPKPEPGFFLVHRLDMETSGCLLVAKNRAVLEKLVRDFSERKIEKVYWAIVVGEIQWNRKIVSSPILYERADVDPPRGRKKGTPEWVARRRSPKALKGIKKGKVVEADHPRGKASETHFFVEERFRGFTLVRCEPKSGRTHQIRIHLASEGFPLAYDPLYGRATPIRQREFNQNALGEKEGEKVFLNRLPLHALKLAFIHPESGHRIQVEAPVPGDLRDFLKILARYRTRKSNQDATFPKKTR